MKIRVERIECYYANGSGKTRNYYFYIDFPRRASKEEEATRKAFIKTIKQYETTEGRGYNWRVSVQTLRATVNFLPDPRAIKAEMQRFDREGVKPPSEPYHVNHMSLHDSNAPDMISLTFDDVPEAFRRACHYWQTTHRVYRAHLNLFGGRQITITRDMLLAFESWLVFDKPWQEMYTEAFADRKEMDDEIKERWRQEEEQYRAKYPGWDQWTKQEQDAIRWKDQEERFEQMRTRMREEYQQQYGYRSFGFTSVSQVAQAFEVFDLPHTATLQDVKKRYRALSKKYHPDMPTGNEAQFKKINNANEVLYKYFETSN